MVKVLQCPKKSQGCEMKRDKVEKLIYLIIYKYNLFPISPTRQSITPQTIS